MNRRHLDHFLDLFGFGHPMGDELAQNILLRFVILKAVRKEVVLGVDATLIIAVSVL